MRRFQILLVFVLLGPPAVAQPATARPSHVTIEYAVFWPSEPKRPPLPVMKGVAAKRHPELRFVDRAEETPDDVAVWARVLPTSEYPAPTATHLKRWGRGLKKTQIAKMKQSKTALVLRAKCPRGEVEKAMRALAPLCEYMARRSKAFIWDAETKELFSTGAWRKQRSVDAWIEGVPRVDREVVVDVEEKDEVYRAVSRGMSKFGQPDVVVAAFAKVHVEVAEQLVMLACQTMAETGGPWPKGSIKLDIDRLEHFEFKEDMVNALGKRAHRKAIIALGEAARSKTDPDNGLIEIAFAGAPATPLPERQEALFVHVFGEPKEKRGKATPREAEKIASRLARRRLFKEVKPHFRGGVPAGETLLIKAPFKNTKGQREYLWIELESWDVSRVHGALMNTPRNIPTLKEGQKVSVSDADIFDYKWYKADGTVEGNTTETARNNKKKK